jgi:CheY-like chemotaxis protein
MRTGNHENKLSILIVDDDEDYRFLLRDEIEQLNDNLLIFEAESGQEAIKFVSNNPTVDIIVLDYHMEEMNGPEVLKKLKEIGIEKVAIGLTRLGKKQQKELINSCAIDAFSKDIIFLKKEANHYG